MIQYKVNRQSIILYEHDNLENAISWDSDLEALSTIKHEVQVLRLKVVLKPMPASVVVESLPASRTSSFGHLQEVYRTGSSGNLNENPEDALAVGRARRGKRTYIAQELLATERTYVKNLEVIVSMYLKTMKAGIPKLGSGEEVGALFSNVEGLLALNQKMLEEMESIMGQWGDETEIGQAWQRWVPGLRLYEGYYTAHSNAVAVLLKLHRRNETFAKFLADRQTITGQTLDSFLLMPVQRLPRYALLLQDLHRNTPSSHPDHPHLAKAVEMLRGLMESLNESQRRAENDYKLLSVEQLFPQDNLQLLDNPSMHTPKRSSGWRGSDLSLQKLKRENKSASGSREEIMSCMSNLSDSMSSLNSDEISSKPARWYIQDALFRAEHLGKSRERQLFLFSDLLLVAAPSRSNKG
eukprot:Colp12_sorted_trinity150504_noHs@24625